MRQLPFRREMGMYLPRWESRGKGPHRSQDRHRFIVVAKYTFTNGISIWIYNIRLSSGGVIIAALTEGDAEQYVVFCGDGDVFWETNVSGSDLDSGCEDVNVQQMRLLIFFGARHLNNGHGKWTSSADHPGCSRRWSWKQPCLCSSPGLPNTYNWNVGDILRGPHLDSKRNATEATGHRKAGLHVEYLTSWSSGIGLYLSVNALTVDCC